MCHQMRQYSVSSELLMLCEPTRFSCGAELKGELISSVMYKSGELDLEKSLLLFSLFTFSPLLFSDAMNGNSESP